MSWAPMEYLDKYAEPEARIVTQLTIVGKGRWEEAVILPLCGEPETLDTLRSVDAAAQFSKARTLAILVVNARESHPAYIHDANAALLSQLAAPENKKVRCDPPTTLVAFSAHLDLLVIDRASPGFFFPEDQGVGLARKIGCDLAVALCEANVLECGYLHTTDGDAVVSNHYFEIAPQGPLQGIGGVKPAAFLHHYEHTFNDDRDSHALCLYEISLRYYVLGLRYAGSPYAFHTVGSAIAFSPQSYADVRGFPRRDAAEDFYLLNKLAKVGGVGQLAGTVTLKPRPSSRVPFGTGASMAKIAANLDGGGSYSLYHPQTFVWLRAWLEALRDFSHHRDQARVTATLQREGGAGLVETLEAMGSVKALETARKSRPQQRDLLRHLFTWFDAFQTLKLVHAVRDAHMALIPYETALHLAPFLPPLPAGSPQGYLNALRHTEWQDARESVMRSVLSDSKGSGYNEGTDAACKTLF